MKAIFKYLLLFVCVYTTGINTVLADTASARIPPHAWIDAYKHQKAYQYKQETGEAVSAWDIFTEWLSKLLGKIFYNASAEKAWEYIKYIGIAAVVIFLAWYFYKHAHGGVMQKEGTIIPTGIAHDDIHQLDFDTLIQEAEANQNYRWAIRWHYVQYLKNIDARSIINWAAHKTNFDYSREIKSDDERSKFRKIARQYEDAWYGETNVAVQEYKDYKELISSSIRQQAA